MAIQSRSAQLSYSLQSATAPPYSSNFILAAALLLQKTGSLGFSAMAWVKSLMARW